MGTVTRPLLLLDVDGVLNPYPPDPPVGFTDHYLFPGEEPVRVNPATGRPRGSTTSIPRTRTSGPRAAKHRHC